MRTATWKIYVTKWLRMALFRCHYGTINSLVRCIDSWHLNLVDCTDSIVNVASCVFEGIVNFYPQKFSKCIANKCGVCYNKLIPIRQHEKWQNFFESSNDIVNAILVNKTSTNVAIQFIISLRKVICWYINDW